MKNIFVGNLPSSAKPVGLRKLFEVYGEVTHVNVVEDRDTGLTRFAFVEMRNTNDASRAISSLNGAAFGGKTLHVEEARPRLERRRNSGAA
jgi:RNA recognition motif-containing protein